MDEIVSTGLLASFIEHLFQLVLSIRSRVKSVENVRADVTREEYWLLLHNSNLLMVPFGVQKVNIDIVE